MTKDILQDQEKLLKDPETFRTYTETFTITSETSTLKINSCKNSVKFVWPEKLLQNPEKNKKTIQRLF